MEEIWKPYVTYAGCRNQYDGSYHQYLCTDIEISNFGNIRGNLYARKKFNGLKPRTNGQYKGRICVGVKPLYRLVYELFVGPIPEGYVVHHIDHNKLNDRIDNLMLMTKKDHSKLHREFKIKNNKCKQLQSQL